VFSRWRRALARSATRFERVGHRITGDRSRQTNSRGGGWESVHVCIDASRIAFTQIKLDEKAISAVDFLKRQWLITRAVQDFG
jgi:hypothetical protein